MKVYRRGEGKPEYTVTGSIHGDEPCGKKAIENFLEKDFEFKKPVQFIVANEEALEKNVRYIDTDLNRSFPGDSESDSHEERLAAKIHEKIRGTILLDIHSTHSHPEPFATFDSLDMVNQRLLQASGVDNAVLFVESSGTIKEQVRNGIVVEAGHQHSEEAVENAEKVIENFLAAEGVIDAEFERSNPDMFRYFETVDGDWTFMAENFRKVEKGEVFAERDGEKLVADREFYPVLMSTEGYDGMLGHKAEKLGKVAAD